MTRLAFPKPPPRVIAKAAKQQAKQLTERAAKNAVWVRAGYRCERCHVVVSRRTTSMLYAGHIHHKKRRSTGGGLDPENLLLLCARCHANAHNGRGPR